MSSNFIVPVMSLFLLRSYLDNVQTSPYLHFYRLTYQNLVIFKIKEKQCKETISYGVACLKSKHGTK